MTQPRTSSHFSSHRRVRDFGSVYQQSCHLDVSIHCTGTMLAGILFKNCGFTGIYTRTCEFVAAYISVVLILPILRYAISGKIVYKAVIGVLCPDTRKKVSAVSRNCTYKVFVNLLRSCRLLSSGLRRRMVLHVLPEPRGPQLRMS
jgi:hypothetical protein